MANTIGSVTQYLNTIVERIYRLNSLTTFLDTTGVVTSGLANAKEVKIPKLSLDGLSDYSRTAGYTSGDVTLEYVTYTLAKDRGKKFFLDAVDNIDSAGVALAELASTFIRDKVNPELDAYRFAQYAAGAEAANVKALALTKSNIVGAIDDAGVALTDAEVPEENRILFITAAAKALLKQALDSSRFHTSKIIDRNVEMFDDMPLITVPTGRFYSAVDLNDGGYAAASGAVGLNFILMDRNAPLQIVKHNPARLFTPDQNQDADAYVYNYRCYHDCVIRENKKAGVYVCKKSS